MLRRGAFLPLPPNFASIATFCSVPRSKNLQNLRPFQQNQWSKAKTLGHFKVSNRTIKNPAPFQHFGVGFLNRSTKPDNLEPETR